MAEKTRAITGQLTALSHVLKTCPASMRFLEMMNEEKINYVAVLSRRVQQFCDKLKLGETYEVTNLFPKRMTCSDGSKVTVLVTSDCCKFIPRSPNEMKLLHCRFQLSNYEGTVTAEVCSPLGMYMLDNRVLLCLGFLMKIAKVKIPKLGEHVSVFNAHWMPDGQDSRPCLIVCGRGYILVPDGSNEVETTDVLSCMSSSWTYSDLMWLKKQLLTFDLKFTPEFLKENNIASSSEQLVTVTMKMHHPNPEGDKRVITREFLSSPHHCQCAMSSKSVNYTSYQTLQALCGSESQSNLPWTYSIDCRDGVVGVFTISPTHGYWMLSDATQSIPCVLTGDMDIVAQLHGAVALLTSCTVVHELFSSGTSVKYLHVATKNIQVLHKPSESSECGDLLSKKLVPTSNRSWLILVHHKTTPISLYGILSCYLLVSLIGQAEENTSEMVGCARRFLFVLQGKLIRYVPILQTNNMYLLHLPDTEESDAFDIPLTLQDMSQWFPDVPGFCVPEDSLFCPANSQLPSHIIFKNDCYSVGDDCLDDEFANNELVNIEGEICDRLHTDILFPSEKLYLDQQGFGVPDNKTITLKLHDRVHNCGKVVCLYLKGWNWRAYPIGLIRGALIRAMFVSVSRSQKHNNLYFQTTKLTYLQVLQMPDQIKQIHLINNVVVDKPAVNTVISLGACSEGQTKLLGGPVNSIKLLKLTANVMCASCNEGFRQGMCGGCHVYPPTPKLAVVITCCVEDIFGKVYIFVNDDLAVRLLGLSKPYWDVITKLVSFDGRDIEITQCDLQKSSSDPIGKRVLQALMSAADKKKSRFYMTLSRFGITEDAPKYFCTSLRKPRMEIL